MTMNNNNGRALLFDESAMAKDDPVERITVELTNGCFVTAENTGRVLIRGKADNRMAVKRFCDLPFTHGTHTFNVKVNACTFIETSLFMSGDEFCIIALAIKGEFIAHSVLSASFYDMFDSLDTLKKKSAAISKFQMLPNIQQSKVEKILRSVTCSVDTKTSAAITDPVMLDAKFNLTANTYTPQQRSDIRCLFSELNSAGINRFKTIKKLTYILNIEQHDPEKITLTKEQIISELDKRLYKLDSVKEKIAEAVVASKYTERKGFSILLVGNPGVGKTSIAKTVAEVINYPLLVIPMGSATSTLELVGDASQYESSDAGSVVKAFYKAGTTSAVMLIDEYDKSCESARDGKVSRAFNDALSGDASFRDEFIDTYIDVSNTIFIATANTTDGIPKNILNRFTVIHVPDYNEADKAKIAKQFIIPKLLKKYGVEPNEFSVSDDAIRLIVNNYCADDGARDIYKNIESVLRKVLADRDSKSSKPVTVSKKFVEKALENFVDKNDPSIIYRRNKKLYTPKACGEIAKLRSKLSNDNLPNEEKRKAELILDYLVHLIPAGNAFKGFDEEIFFDELNKTHYGLDEIKDTVARIFYTSSVCKKPLTGNRLLLVGPPGTGKSSVVRSIAKACGAPFEKISLNGISDPSFIKGIPSGYSGADAGAVVKACRRMGTTKGVIQLDEIDKLFSRSDGNDITNTMIDLLDDSAEFTDLLLGYGYDLSNILFIATANSLSNISPLITDRFTVINIEGYTLGEKNNAAEKYIIPRAISECCPSGKNLSFSDDARNVMIETYCRSTGMRDTEKAVKKIIIDKIYANRNSDSADLVITAEDVSGALGSPDPERGNYPYEEYPGLSRGLAVTGDGRGMTFAVETILIPDEKEELTITGLPCESTSDSVKIAKSIIMKMMPDRLKNVSVHVHFGEGAVHKDGPSAGLAVLMSFLSAVYEKPIAIKAAFTGEINCNGYIFGIGGVLSKIQAARSAGCTHVYIPYDNYTELKGSDKEQFKIKLVPVKHFKEIVSDLFPDPNPTDKGT